MRYNTFIIILLGILFFFTTPILGQNFTKEIDTYFKSSDNKGKFSSQDIQWQVSSKHISKKNGVQHVYFNQTHNGIEIFGTESSIHILPDGKILTASNSFKNKESFKIIDGTSPSLSAIQAVTSVAKQLNYSLTKTLTITTPSLNLNQETKLSKGGISLSNIPAKLVYTLNNHKLVLAWDISIQEISQKNWWSIRVDASTGLIINKTNWMLSCTTVHNHDKTKNHNKTNLKITNNKNKSGTISACNDCYEVFAMPLESPYYGNRSIETLPQNLIASPFGWHDTNGVIGAEFNDTRGNNVDAFEDGDNSGFRPNGGTNLDFSGSTFNQIWSNANQYEEAAIINLFYWNNIIHDVLYQYGFDEAAGNFQENNYGNGALGNDSVIAEGQKGLQCNAFFGTPADGSSPTMQMYVCNNDDKDGDFDNLVITHEYGHGISNRLTGGASNAGCLNNVEQMGEGWSDFYGVLLTMNVGDTGTDERGIGTYLFGQGIGATGIRDYPYTTDIVENPQTYDDIKTAVIPHGIGSIWTTMLWEMTWGLIDEYGFDADVYNFTGNVNLDAGNVMAIALVTEGLKLQPCSPGYVDGRDAILAADQAIYGGANYCIIWNAFAKRGLGFSADQGSSNSRSDGTEAFDLPTTTLETNTEICISQGTQIYGGGLPVGGTYSGNGVTNNGDGLTYTFDPSSAGIGTHNIIYTSAITCLANNSATDIIEVTTNIPEIICQNTTIEIDINGEATITIPDIVTNLLPQEYTVDQTGTFSPETITGTTVNLGDDNGTTALAIGFDFNFLGTTYSNFHIASNGFVSFDGSGMTGQNSWTPTALPSTTIPNNMIAVVWDDLSPNNGGTIRYETIGTVPNRKLIVDYINVPLYNSSATVTTQLQLHEGSNRIEIHSTDVQNNNGNRTQGIESDGTESITTPNRNLNPWTATNDYVAYYLAPTLSADNCGSPTTVSLSKDTFSCNNLGDNEITITIDDGNGNINTCTAIVTVENPNNYFSTIYEITGWSNQVPDIDKCVIINTDYNTTINSFSSLKTTVNPTFNLTIASNTFVEIQENLVNNGTITIEPNGSLVQIDDNATVTGNGIFTTRIETTPLDDEDRFTYFSSPTAIENLNVFSPWANTNRMFSFNNSTQFWEFENTATTMNTGQGFAIKGNIDAGGAGYPSSPITDFIGEFNNGVVTQDIYTNIGDQEPDSIDDDSNLIGNPYPSAINADLLLTQNPNLAALYFWTHATALPINGDNFPVSDYAVWTIGTGTLGKTANIASGQGFFATGINGDGVTPTVTTATINNSMRVTTGNNDFKSTLKDRIWLNLTNTNTNTINQIAIVFIEEGSDNFDHQYDALTYDGGFASSFYSIDANSNHLAIQAKALFTSNEKIIPLGLTVNNESISNLKISIDHLENLEGVQIYLKDHFLNTIYHLNQSDYFFNISEIGSINERFELLFTREALSVDNEVIDNDTLVISNQSDTKIKVIMLDGSIITNFKGYNALGKLVIDTNANTNNFMINTQINQGAVLFIKATLENGQVLSKKFIKL